MVESRFGSPQADEAYALEYERMLPIGRALGLAIRNDILREAAELDRDIAFSQTLTIARGLLRREDTIQEMLNAPASMLDDKTGLLNFTTFQELAHERTGKRERSTDIGRQHALLLFDLDDFKRINDILGYQRTDEVCLLPAVKILQTAVHRQQDLVARWGGDEFVVLLTDVDGEQATLIAEQIQQAVSAIRWGSDGLEESIDPQPLTASVGVAMFIQGEPISQVFDEANIDLNSAKQVKKDPHQSGVQSSRTG